ncbi:MAG: hypothetical protein ABI459_02980 [Deltaproteobacteria bacterium]
MKHLITMLFLTVLSACGSVDYPNRPAGQFQGQVFLMWVDDGGPDGQGVFLFIPNPHDPFRFTRAAAGQFQTIEPAMIYTDGGSVPKLAQAFRGFSPWGYGPAYILHDWLFAARKCSNAGQSDLGLTGIETMPFQTSADILAEAIKTLIAERRVSPDDVAPHLISAAVAGPASNAIWTRDVTCSAVTPEDQIAAEAAIPGASQRTLRGTSRMTEDGEVPVKKARVIAAFSF